jgi:peptide/nickel transport system substrate-binding protein
VLKRITSLIGAFVLAISGCAGDGETVSTELPFTARSWPASEEPACSKNDEGEPIPGLAKIVAESELKIRFELCAPDAAFLVKLALSNFTINDSGYLKAHTSDGTISEHPNGTGPFQLQAWEHGSQLVLTRNESYWGSAAKANTLVFQWQADASGRLLALKAGTADVVSNAAPSDYAEILSNPTLRLVQREPLAVTNITLSNNFKPFDDVRVRRAVAYAINRQRLVDAFYPAGSSVATHYTPCTIPMACGGDDWYPYDPKEARRLLAAAGYPNGFKTTMTLIDVVSTHTPFPIDIATDIQAQLKEVGIEVVLNIVDRATFVATVNAGTVDGLVRGGFNADYPDPSNFLSYYFLPSGGGAKRIGTIDSKIVAALRAAGSAPDAEQRALLYAQANDEIKRTVAVIPLVHAASAAAYQADVTGYQASPFELERIAEMDPGGRDRIVWILAEEPAGLYCADEANSDTFRVCSQIFEGLYGFNTGSSEVSPLLATGCLPSNDLLSWTCSLREGVRFQQGQALDAGDVLDSFASIWDCAHPYHKGRLSLFANASMLSPFLHPEACASEE